MVVVVVVFVRLSFTWMFTTFTEDGIPFSAYICGLLTFRQLENSLCR